MTRIKKTRKAGDAAPKHAPRTKKSERVLARKKQDSGNKAGSRQNPEGSAAKGSQAAKDPRIGSKKPVALGTEVMASQAKVAKTKLTDEQRLLQLEEDPRLNQLLDMLEEGRDLSAADQQWLEQQLAKIETLMQKLGIEDLDETDIVSNDSDEALLDKFDTGLAQLQNYQKE
ncbi:Der GTPase-activating protein YihI [Shewanella dokdonensis]|uniref:Der GTPase-activating protein YihI n=1 Tax=Shewanella dokdonensis TaxID=712036 RepID=A0ABX8DJP7_9GAMM|nr:Der GTPase-activating protein YihI [Shewanella dokdonensis]MCL1075554.1 GTPase-activating protein [Shewanella dokdonensis]QVK24575.1 GTPase-activating protein [Shewanella dokdonensis]